MDVMNIHTSHMHTSNLRHMHTGRMHTSGTPVGDVVPSPATASFPAYYLGRPVAMYQRRYRRRATASGRPA